MTDRDRKDRGAYYTPDPVVQMLVRWAVRRPGDRLLDPACGDGRFLAVHPSSVGVEQDPEAAVAAHRRAPGSLVHQGDFFTWAAQTRERFDCVVGNPPFIRYQRFTGPVRDAALRLCAQHGAAFSALTSSWAPFLVAAATRLVPGGRMAFVVPAEIGHAPYASPLLRHLAQHFRQVRIIAVQDRLFPDLSEACWLLYAEGFGERTDHFMLTPIESLARLDRLACDPAAEPGISVTVAAWQHWNERLRPFLLPQSSRELYQRMSLHPSTRRLGELARIGIGYVTGANEFFHLRPSTAHRAGIPPRFLRPSVRNSKALPLDSHAVTRAHVDAWLKADAPCLLLDLQPGTRLVPALERYLDSEAGQQARAAYKCRIRDPWYVVPDVTAPDAFLSYMSTDTPALVANEAGCVGTNSIHRVTLRAPLPLARLQAMWTHPFTTLSCELEGHPLGGGMLKLEPREAQRVLLCDAPLQSPAEQRLVQEGIERLRRWRHRPGTTPSDE